MNFFQRYLAIKKYLNEKDEVLLHLGCGDQDSDDYLNIDIEKKPHIHFIKDVSNLYFIKDGFADMIYASHVLEHFSHRDIVVILRGWYEKIKIGGVLRLSVPDFKKMMFIYNNENEDMSWVIDSMMGGQDSKYNFHKSLFDFSSLSKILKEVGFKEVRLWSPSTAKYYSFNDWASRRINDKYEVSLNIEAIK